MLDAGDLVRGEPDVDAGVKGRIEVLDVDQCAQGCR